MIMPGCGWARREGSAQVEAQDRPALADVMPRARHHRSALLRACEAMYEHDERPGHGAGRPVEPRRQPVAAGDLKQQALAARQVRRNAAQKVAQSLQIAPKPGRPFAERWNRPGRHVVAILQGRGSPHWHVWIHQVEAVLLLCRAFEGFSRRKLNPNTRNPAHPIKSSHANRRAATAKASISLFCVSE